jgi:hypothetical protein
MQKFRSMCRLFGMRTVQNYHCSVEVHAAARRGTHVHMMIALVSCRNPCCCAFRGMQTDEFRGNRSHGPAQLAR